MRKKRINKYIKKFYIFIITISLFILTACSFIPEEKSVVKYTPKPIVFEDTVKAKIYLPTDLSNEIPKNSKSIEYMLSQMNNKLKKDINTTISINWLARNNYDEELMTLMASKSSIDAFSHQSFLAFKGKEYLRDLSNSFSTYAPRYYEFINKKVPHILEGAFINGKISYVPSVQLTPVRHCVIVKNDILKKTGIQSIHSIEEYINLLEHVKEIEEYRDKIPGYANAEVFINAYLSSKGYFKNRAVSLYSNWNDDAIKLYAIENIKEFEEATDIFKDLSQKELISGYTQDTRKIFENPDMISVFYSMKDDYNDFTMAFLSQEYKYEMFVLYEDVRYERSVNNNGIGIYSNSHNTENILQFMEWLNLNQENYDLFHYGVEKVNYKWDGIRVLSIENNAIINWAGSEVFENFEYKRPNWYETDKYQEFLEKSALVNTYIQNDVNDYFHISMEKFKNPKELSAIQKEYRDILPQLNDSLQIYYDYIGSLNNGKFNISFEAFKKSRDDKKIQDVIAYYLKIMKEK